MGQLMLFVNKVGGGVAPIVTEYCLSFVISAYSGTANVTKYYMYSLQDKEIIAESSSAFSTVSDTTMTKFKATDDWITGETWIQSYNGTEFFRNVSQWDEPYNDTSLYAAGPDYTAIPYPVAVTTTINSGCQLARSAWTWSAVSQWWNISYLSESVQASGRTSPCPTAILDDEVNHGMATTTVLNCQSNYVFDGEQGIAIECVRQHVGEYDIPCNGGDFTFTNIHKIDHLTIFVSESAGADYVWGTGTEIDLSNVMISIIADFSTELEADYGSTVQWQNLNCIKGGSTFAEMGNIYGSVSIVKYADSDAYIPAYNVQM